MVYILGRVYPDIYRALTLNGPWRKIGGVEDAGRADSRV